MEIEGLRIGRDDQGRLNADILAEQMRITGEEFADADAAADLLEAQKRPLLAVLTNQERALDLKMSRREAEDRALADGSYQIHLHACIKARHKAAIARARYEAVKTFARAVQTQEANQRALMYPR